MSQSLRRLYGRKLGASDGDIGHVKDFYFNDARPKIEKLLSRIKTCKIAAEYDAVRGAQSPFS